ncbi:MAG: hypothetical protein ONB52_21955 [candidate division KSB1 bacterium]|nr:hypothetical protein [candidate division KSB1 bacterium]
MEIEKLELEVWQAWIDTRAVSLQRAAARIACGCRLCGGTQTEHRAPQRLLVVDGDQVALDDGTLRIGRGWLSYTVRQDAPLHTDLLWWLGVGVGDDSSIAAYAILLYDGTTLVPDFPVSRVSRDWLWHGKPARAFVRADVARAGANLRYLLDGRAWLVGRGVCRGHVVVDDHVAADTFQLCAIDASYNRVARDVAERYQIPVLTSSGGLR